MPPLRQSLTAARTLSDNPSVVSKLDVIDATLTAALEYDGAESRALDRSDLPALGAAGAAHASAGVFAGGVELRAPGSRSFAWLVLSLDRLTADVDCSIGATITTADDEPQVRVLEAWLSGATHVAASRAPAPV